jgi:nucleoside-diphosphate-sugar epimerase
MGLNQLQLSYHYYNSLSCYFIKNVYYYLAMKKKALVTGAGGFVGTHLIRKLKRERYWIRGVDLKKPQYSKTQADEFLILDLRKQKNCTKSLKIYGGFDEVYNLAADRGGAGYMEPFAAEMMKNNVLINVYMITEAVKLKRKPLFFFSSSVCIYKDMDPKDPVINEAEAYPALPENEYGWEKLYSERMLTEYGRRYNMPVRIARFQTTYGPEANWEGGREKAADALCRKAAMTKDGGKIEVWGNGKAIRSFTYIDDLIEGIRKLMKSSINTPTNIGSDEYVTVEYLAKTAIKASDKNLKINYIKGAVGVKARNFSLDKLKSTGWKQEYSLEDGIKIHYKWVEEQVEKKYGKKKVSIGR